MCAARTEGRETEIWRFINRQWRFDHGACCYCCWVLPLAARQIRQMISVCSALCLSADERWHSAGCDCFVVIMFGTSYSLWCIQQHYKFYIVEYSKLFSLCCVSSQQGVVFKWETAKHLTDEQLIVMIFMWVQREVDLSLFWSHHLLWPTTFSHYKM